MTVTYEDLCASPAAVLDAICERVRMFGVPFQRLDGDLPNLTPTPPSPLPENLHRRLQECLATGR